MALKLNHGEDDLAENAEMNLTPFIDVMLVLLIIFMVVAPLSTASVDIDLPALAAKPQAMPEEPVELSLDASGTLRLGDAPVQVAHLAEAVTLATAGDHDRRIFMRVDKQAQMAPVMEAMDHLRQAGFTHIGLLGAAGKQ
ncbi:biopolymer transporter ExbD [Novosphingobium umbonatum]|uniref:Biopolymer transporter ExbD n=1 Tax=Novosphingobium umbonatum TaxID=1908524 RepID=A0A3S2V3B4_9SPHN|nr:biopolymer transporter ExbD [Novosphingobium umbonatum]RVU02262.1 biopolymer transporter ExbD [Novosphingobium umbonatum]